MISEIAEKITDSSLRVKLDDVSGGSLALFISRLIRSNLKLLAILPDDESAERLYRDLLFFAGAGEPAREILLLPLESVSPYGGLSPDVNEVRQRLAAALALAARHEKLKIVIATPLALLKKLPPKSTLESAIIPFNIGDVVSREELAKRILELGYQPLSFAEEPATFSVRGGIIDIYPPTFDNPVRIELLGDEIDRIVSFDPQSQLSIASHTEIAVPPAKLIIYSPENRARALDKIKSLAESSEFEGRFFKQVLEDISEGRFFFGMEALTPAFYGELVPPRTYIEPLSLTPLVVEPSQTLAAFERIYRQEEENHQKLLERGEVVLPPHSHFDSPRELVSFLGSKHRIEIVKSPKFPVQLERSYESGYEPDNESSVAPEIVVPKCVEPQLCPLSFLREQLLNPANEDPLEPLIKLISESKERKCIPIIVTNSQTQAERIKNLLGGRNIQTRLFPEGSSPLDEGRDTLWGAGVPLFIGDLSSGVVDSEIQLALIAEHDIFGEKITRVKKPKPTRGAPTLKELELDDLVVHIDFGIGLYKGLAKLVISGVENDFILLEYRDGDKLYLPVTSIDLLRRYRRLGGDNSKILLDKLGSTRWVKARKRVNEAVLKLASELLELYAVRSESSGIAFDIPGEEFREFESLFKYSETDDQRRAIEEVIADMQKPRPMDRLLVGDVGYGKTEVAMRAAYLAALAGFQSAVLVPTTVLAMQHYLSFVERFDKFPVKIEFLSRFQSKKEQERIIKETKEGKVDILIGTHRLLSEDIVFKKLGLLVIDEEHRFGVKHKERIKRLRANIDVLTMTATPIPRTLHLALVNLRDMSLIATPPPDRRAVKTFLVKREAAALVDIIKREIQRGGQVFFVHNRVKSIPLVLDELKALLPDIRIGVAHGQMPELKLERAMIEFIKGESQLLLCTDIIESGLDIPNANTIIIDDADMFGLAQLYQLRGRVGRSYQRAFCYLLVGEFHSLSKDAEMRLNAILEHQSLGSGFSIASQDLDIRGAGDLLGAEQSGHIAAVGFDLFTELLADTVERMKKGEIAAGGEKERVEVKLPVTAMIPEIYVPDIKERLAYYQRFASAEGEEKVAGILDELREIYGAVPEETDNLAMISRLKTVAKRVAISHISAGTSFVSLKFSDERQEAKETLKRLIEERKIEAKFTNGVLKLPINSAETLLTDTLSLVKKLGEIYSGACPPQS